jgi:hypothetical protein
MQKPFVEQGVKYQAGRRYIQYRKGLPMFMWPYPGYLSQAEGLVCSNTHRDILLSRTMSLSHTGI